MKKTVKSLLSVLLTLLLAVLPLCAVSALAEVSPAITVIAEGNCGVPDEDDHPTDNVTYTVTSDGVMTLRGTGAMADSTNVTFAFGGPEWRKNYADQITTLVVKPGVTSIGDYGFREFTKLTSVSLPASVTRIGKDAFRACEVLTSVVLSSALQTIGQGAFYDCDKLTVLSIPDSVTSIGEEVFRDCDSLYAVSLPGGIGVIPKKAFYGCNRLQTVTVPGEVSEICESAFGYCENLRDVFYLAPIDRWSSIDVCDTYDPGSIVGGGNRALESAVVHSHYPGGGTSGFVDKDSVFTPTCGAPAGYYHVEICCYCCTELGRTWVQTAPATGNHTAGAAVRENEVAPTCTAAGSYDEVIRCSVCTNVLSRTHKTVDPLGHIHTTASPENAATATAHGFTAGVYCMDCENWISGHEVIHNTLGEYTVLQPPTATEAGRATVRCTVCGEETICPIAPVPAADPPADNQGDAGVFNPFASVIGAFRKFVNWVLHLLERIGLK